MRWLYDLIVQSVRAIGQSLLSFGRAVIYHYKIAAAAMVAVAVFVKDIIVFCVNLVVDLIERMGALNDAVTDAEAVSGGGLFDAGLIGHVNAFVPLEEMVSMLFVLATVYALSSIIRAIKGWVPTLN